MTNFPSFLEDSSRRHRLRLQTLTRLRWLAVTGQSLAVIIIAYVYSFDFPEFLCFILIACSACLNVFLSVHFPAAHRLSPLAAAMVLAFDVLQLSGLLFITGGVANPFSMLLCVPVIISSASQPVRYTVGLGIVSTSCLTFLTFFSLPLPWYPGIILDVHFLLIAGSWISIVSTTIFAAVYSYQVSAEANELADALAATELVLQREQHLSALDGLAAAAAHELGTPLATIQLVTREMERSLADDPRFADDLALLRSQTIRCRDILRQLTTLSTEDEAHMVRLPLDSLIEEVIAPHREFGIAIEVIELETDQPVPVGRRNPAILFGLGNLIENAVDFAKSRVTVTVGNHKDDIILSIEDDGPGFAIDVLAKIGVPFIKRRTRLDHENAGGLGLGLFIAKTLLERSGAKLEFSNKSMPKTGASVKISWPREKLGIFES